jgi:nicotinic acid phosphoribosyltransferase
VPHALACFQKKFQYFVKNIERMDELFEAVKKLFVDYDDFMTINILYRLSSLELEL